MRRIYFGVEVHKRFWMQNDFVTFYDGMKKEFEFCAHVKRWKIFGNMSWKQFGLRQKQKRLRKRVGRFFKGVIWCFVDTHHVWQKGCVFRVKHLMGKSVYFSRLVGIEIPARRSNCIVLFERKIWQKNTPPMIVNLEYNIVSVSGRFVEKILMLFLESCLSIAVILTVEKHRTRASTNTNGRQNREFHQTVILCVCVGVGLKKARA